MRSLNPFTQRADSLISAYAAKMVESTVVRRAAAEAKTARAEAELSIRARSQFLANMNHELRTPLNAVIGFATMLRDGRSYELSEEKQQSYAEYILQSADLLLGHINTILETAALDSGEIEINQTQTDLAPILRSAAERMKITAKALNVSVVLKTEEEAIYAWVDEDRVSQAIDHLLRIALKASERGDQVFARIATDADGWPEIAVRDTGKGLSDAELNAALNAFAGVNRGLDRSFEGPGVELAIAKTFVEMQGGKFRIKSKVGKGTLVRASLPPRPPQECQQGEEAPEDVRLAG
ncbi:MAG: HAMP domain-containing sensor histidine kinase [Pseudomonadota bacterium]